MSILSNQMKRMCCSKPVTSATKRPNLSSSFIAVTQTRNFNQLSTAATCQFIHKPSTNSNRQIIKNHCPVASSFAINHIRSSNTQHTLGSTIIRCFSSKSYPEHILLTMPALSPTMERGNLSAWKKKIGDKISVGEVMADVETDKATVAFEAVEEGYLAKILVQDGSNEVEVGTPVAVVAENEEDIAKFADFAPSGSSESKSAPLGDTGEKTGDQQVKKTKSENSDAQHQQAQQEEISTHHAKEPKQSIDKQQQQQQSSHSNDQLSSSSLSTGGRIVASPNARRIAGERGISLSQINPTGSNGRILTADVEEQGGKQSQQQQQSSKQSQQSQSSTSEASGEFQDHPLSNMRKVIAQRLLQSKTSIPHYYLTSQVCVDQLMKIRSEFNSQSVKQDGDKAIKLSLNDFIIKASALACKRVPQVNSSWQTSFIRQFNYVDISIAVSTDAGLVTPIVVDADIRGLQEIASNVKSLAAKARANKLSPQEYQGGTFTISNLGMFGVNSFSAIINPPQAAILAVGTTTQQIQQNENKDFVTKQLLTVTLSCDHRVVDGAVGAQWLQAFKQYIENPISMIL